MKPLFFVVSLAIVLLSNAVVVRASDAVADTYQCLLEGQQVVPPTPQYAVGWVDFQLSATHELSFQVSQCYYSTDVVAHIHGPAAPGAIGPVIFTLQNNLGLFNWKAVLGTLDDQQLRDLNCGLWYVDIHTLQYPQGEVRGWIRGNWGWSILHYPCVLATEESTWGAVKARYR